MPKKISEQKKDQFLAACDNLELLKVLPEKMLRAKLLSEMLSMDDIEADMLYKCGCPYEWIKFSKKNCTDRGKIRKPKYCNECTICWIQNITEDCSEPEELEYNFQEILSRLNNFEKFKLTYEQMEQILNILDWDKTYDYNVFIQQIKNMKNHVSKN